MSTIKNIKEKTMEYMHATSPILAGRVQLKTKKRRQWNGSMKYLLYLQGEYNQLAAFYNYLATCQLTAHLVSVDLSLEHQISLFFIRVGRHPLTQTPLSNPRLVGANQT